MLSETRVIRYLFIGIRYLWTCYRKKSAFSSLKVCDALAINATGETDIEFYFLKLRSIM